MAAEEIEEIDLPALRRFGIGRSSNSLYFDKHRVHTDAVVNLSPAQTKFAVVVGVATMIAALATTVYSGVYLYDTLLRTKPAQKIEVVLPAPLSANARPPEPPVTNSQPNSLPAAQISETPKLPLIGHPDPSNPPEPPKLPRPATPFAPPKP